MAVCSNGKTFAANQKLKRSLKRLGQKQRALSRKTKGSNRSAKAKRAVAKLHYRVSNQRLAVLHEVSDYLTANFRVITIEDLNVRGMTEGRPTRNRKRARAVNDAGFGMLRQFIEYKAVLRGCQVVVADRFFPSSKRCSDPGCGFLNDSLLLSVREWECPNCKTHHDRDHNAGVNLDNYGLGVPVKTRYSSTGSPRRGRPDPKPYIRVA